MKQSCNLWIYLIVVFCFAFWICVAFCACNYVSESENENAPLRVTFLNVNQGLSVLLELDGKFAVYDTGQDSLGFVDTLISRGVRTLEWVAISHGHRDHGGGFMEMDSAIGAKKIKVKRLLVGSDTAVSMVNDSILALAKKYKIPVDTIFRGDTIYFAKDVNIEALWPVSYGNFGGNAASLVLKISLAHALNEFSAGTFSGENSEIGDASLLLEGDLDSVGETRLMSLSPNLKVDLLQVAHHGSASSSKLKFIEQILPRYAVISVGKKNSYGHPAQSVLQKLHYALGDSSNIFRTDLNGSVTFTLYGDIGVASP